MRLKLFKSRSLSSIYSSIKYIIMPINGANAIIFLLVLKSLGLDSMFVEKGGIEKDLSCSERLMAFQKKK